MKSIKFITAFTIAFMFISCSGNAQENNQTASKAINKIEVLDFHSTHRCMTCNAIESSTKYTLEKYFGEEVKAGTITFQIVNIDEEKNYELAEKFEAASTSLYLNVIKDGVETKINLTDFAFTFGNDQPEFSKRFKTKLNKQLKNL